MNRSALLAVLAVGGLIVAVIVLLVAGGKPAERDPGPTITSEPGSSSSPTPVETLQPGEDDPLPQDDTVEGVIDLTAEEAAAETAALAWLTFDSTESAEARADRLVAAGAAADLADSAPSAARADELDGLVDATSKIAVTKVLLVALDEYGDQSATYSVFVELTADYAQPGSAQTLVDGAELLVTVDRTGGLTVVAISEL